MRREHNPAKDGAGRGPARHRSDGGLAPAASQYPALADRVARLERAGLVELRAQWRELCGTDPPRLSRDLLVRALAYRLQEAAFGGLPRASLRQLGTEQTAGGSPSSAPGKPLLRPGARLVREWHGRTHVVTVMDAGFDYAGTCHRSLTSIARLITGAHWSGPRFFGLGAGKETGDGRST